MKVKVNKIQNNLSKRGLFVKISGLLLLTVGLFSLFFIPAEFTSFYAFSEGEKFHYEGFGFGSLMFEFITLNVMAYFYLAIFGISLGIGNFRLKKWGHNLSTAFLNTIFILGITTTISILLSFNLLKNLELYQSSIILTFSLIILVILPYSSIKFYTCQKTKQLFNVYNPNSFFEKQSVNKLTIIILNLFWISIFYLLLFLKGTFPLFGNFIFARQGAYLLSVVIFVLLILTYLFYINKYYAKAIMIVYYILLSFTFVVTFLKNSTTDLFKLLNLPLYEMEIVVPAFRIPAGINLGIFFGLLTIIQIYLISLLSKIKT